MLTGDGLMESTDTKTATQEMNGTHNSALMIRPALKDAQLMELMSQLGLVDMVSMEMEMILALDS